MKTKRYGFYAVLTVVVLSIALLFTNCMDPLSMGGLFGGRSTGTLRLNVDGSLDGTRTIMPTNNFSGYEIQILNNGVGTDPVATRTAWNGTATFDDIDQGNYTVSVWAIGGGADIAYGEDDNVNIDVDSNGTATIVMRPNDNNATGGQGTLAWNFTAALAGQAGPGSIVTFTEVNGGAGTIANIDLVTTPTSVAVYRDSGIYEAVVTVFTPVGLFDYIYTVVVHIYAGMPTTWDEPSPFAYKPDNYTVTFNPNTGSGGTANTVVDHGDPITATITPPTLAEHKFVGWYTQQSTNWGDENNPPVPLGNAWVMGAGGTRVIGTRTLFAHWAFSTDTLNILLTGLSTDDITFGTVGSNSIDISGIMFAANNSAGLYTTEIEITSGSAVLSNFVWTVNGEVLTSTNSATGTLEIDFWENLNPLGTGPGFGTSGFGGVSTTPYTISVTAQTGDGRSWSFSISFLVLEATP
ncbi:MAG: InlB B-repeat-containing protein [Treponema sp.]|nr:InlB B-repeat-containing protein [Treponema sp.]